MKRSIPLALLVLLLSVPGARAQWSPDPATNLVVADAASDQILPKVSPTADGGCWISWFDGIANGFDVRVQKLDAAGNEVLAHGGVLVANRGFSSVQDYGLDTDSAGNALLTFRDDAGTGIQITAAKVSPGGALLWGAAGKQLTATTAFVASPRIAGTGDGGVVVAWTEDASARVQKLDALGDPQWGGGLTLTPGAGSYSPSGLHDAGDDVILGFVHQTGGFGSPRHLLAQKYDSTGSPLWGALPVAVFDGGSLQFGNFPEFAPDGSGGAVFSWYDTAGALQCYAQRVLANGTEAFPHNGTAVSTNAVRVRVSPFAAVDPGTGETFVFWKEQNSAQSQSGVYGQKLDAAGARQWGNDGVALVPVGSADANLIRCVPQGGGAFAFWSSAPSFGQDQLFGAHLSGAGAVDIAIFDVASTPSGKSRLDVAWSTSGFAVLVWSDDRVDAGDVFAQNVNADGSLGGTASSVFVGIGSGHALRLDAPQPNPMATSTWIRYSAPAGAEARLDVVDVGGRVVRTLVVRGVARGAEPAGSLLWDGRDGQGRPVAAGVYFVRLVARAEVTARKVVVVR